MMTQGKHLAVPVSDRDHHQGPATAAVTLVQYGDYECPYTRQSTTIVRAVQQQLGEQRPPQLRASAGRCMITSSTISIPWRMPISSNLQKRLVSICSSTHALWPTNARSPASRRIWRVANAAECKAL